MNKRFTKHGITIIGIAVLAFLAVASTASTPTENSTKTSPTASSNNEVQSGAPLWTGDGGRGMRLGILVPKSQGLSESQGYLPTMVQGVLVTTISKYSAISVLDRVSLDKVIMETLDPTYEDNLDIIRIGNIAQVGYMMTGNVTRTSTGYSLQINVTDTTPNANTIASYSGTCTVAELDDYSAIHRASLDLLSQMKVQLTSEAKNELGRASSRQSINAQTALAQGITAQRQGTEVAALSYFYQAAAFDSSLLEAANRSSILSANITSGNIGNNVRNDIQWRRDWVARLTETENSFYQMINAADPPYTLFYSTAIEQGKVNYQTETVDMSIPINLHGNRVWMNSVQRALQVVYDGLNATKRKNDWGLGNWPVQGVSNTNPFGSQKQYDMPVVFELVNQQGKVISSQTARLRPSFRFSGWGAQVSVNYNENDFNTVVFNAVKADDITDNLTIRIASVNGAAPENTRFQITAVSSQRWQAYQNGLNHLRIENGVVMGFARHLLNIEYRGNGYGDLVRGLSPSLSADQLRQYRNLIISSDMWGEPVITAIGENAFFFPTVQYDDIKITSLTIIGNGITSIGRYAFFHNRLTRITLSDSVTYIGNSAMDNLVKLDRITLGENVQFGTFSPFGSENGGFVRFYQNNGSKAGTYTYANKSWSYKPR